MNREAKIGEHVLCSRLGPEEFEVVEIRNSEYVVKSTITKEKHPIFKVHCHQTIKMVFEGRDRRIARAAKIGAPKIKPGKK